MNPGKHRSSQANESDGAFLRLVNLFATVATEDRSTLMKMTCARMPTTDPVTRRRILAVRTELAVFLPVDQLAAPPSVMAHLDDTRTEKEIAFALDRIITELGHADASTFDDAHQE